MKISHYNSAMDQINVNVEEVLLRFKKENAREKDIKSKRIGYHIPRNVSVAMASIVLIIVLVTSFVGKTGSEIDILFSVNAAGSDERMEISDEPVHVKSNSEFNIMGTSSGRGSVNFDIDIKCEGIEIDSITYKLPGETITRDNRINAIAWFSENVTLPAGEYLDYKGDTSLYEVMGDGTEKHIKRMIGNNYTVAYDGQDEIEYGLEINFDIDENGKVIANEFFIEVEVVMTDGSIFERHIRVIPNIVIQDPKGIIEEMSTIQLIIK